MIAAIGGSQPACCSLTSWICISSLPYIWNFEFIRKNNYRDVDNCLKTYNQVCFPLIFTFIFTSIYRRFQLERCNFYRIYTLKISSFLKTWLFFLKFSSWKFQCSCFVNRFYRTPESPQSALRKDTCEGDFISQSVARLVRVESPP